MGGDDAVQSGRLEVGPAQQLRLAELGQPHAHGVAVRLGRQPSQHDHLHLGKLVIERPMIIELAPHHVGVQAGAADVLADLVDQKDIDVPKRQPGHPLLGQYEQLLFPALELLRRDGLDQGRLVVGVLDDRQPGPDPTVPDHLLRHAADDLVEAMIQDRPMVDRGPLALAQADEHHLQ